MVFASFVVVLINLNKHKIRVYIVYKPWDLKILMKYCCLQFWMERTEECCMS